MFKCLYTKMLKCRCAFTLIEVLTVVTIIILLSGAAFYNLKVSKKSVVESEAYNLLVDFKELQQMSLGSYPPGINEAIDCPNDYCVFGINFFPINGPSAGSTGYRTFIDKDYDFTYDAGSDPVLKTVEFSKGIKGLTLICSTFFTSPFGEISFEQCPINIPHDDCTIEKCFVMVYNDSTFKNILYNNQGVFMFSDSFIDLP